MGNLVHFPCPHDDSRGTVHVMPATGSGFEIGNESASGNSWGSFATYDDARTAITAAHTLNRDVYQGTCNVSICDAALHGAGISRGDF